MVEIGRQTNQRSKTLQDDEEEEELLLLPLIDIEGNGQGRSKVQLSTHKK